MRRHAAVMDREQQYNQKVGRQTFHVVRDGKLLAAAPTLDAAQRTASQMGPGVVVVTPEDRRAARRSR